MPVSCNDPKTTAHFRRAQPNPSTLQHGGTVFCVCSQCTTPVLAKIWFVVSCWENHLLESCRNFYTSLAWGAVKPLGTLTQPRPGSQPRPTPVRWSVPDTCATNTLNYDWNDRSIFWSMGSSCPAQVSFSCVLHHWSAGKYRGLTQSSSTCNLSCKTGRVHTWVLNCLITDLICQYIEINTG